MTRLVLVHGRDLDSVDPTTIEDQWLGALNAGLAAAGSARRVGDDDASFVYYGDTLAHLVGGLPGDSPPVSVHAAGLPAARDAGELRFVLDVAREVLAGAGVAPPADVPTDETVEAEGVVLDALTAALVAALAAVDAHVPGLSGGVVELLARDVHAYLHDDAVRRVLDGGLAAALAGDEPAVVVAHSLGSVIAYSVLASGAIGAQVPMLLTPGSPLGIRAVREALRARSPLRFPEPVRRWVNVRDPGDLLALSDLTPETFPLPAAPAGGADRTGIENLRVDNRAPWNHAAAARVDGGPGGPWAGYLAVPAVAALVGEQLT